MLIVAGFYGFRRKKVAFDLIIISKRECLISFGRRVSPHDYFRRLFQLIAKNADVAVPKSVGVSVKYAHN